jgi:hypothetical protein
LAPQQILRHMRLCQFYNFFPEFSNLFPLFVNQKAPAIISLMACQR